MNRLGKATTLEISSSFDAHCTYGSRFDQYADPQFATLESCNMCAFSRPFILSCELTTIQKHLNWCEQY